MEKNSNRFEFLKDDFFKHCKNSVIKNSKKIGDGCMMRRWEERVDDEEVGGEGWMIRWWE